MSGSNSVSKRPGVTPASVQAFELSASQVSTADLQVARWPLTVVRVLVKAVTALLRVVTSLSAVSKADKIYEGSEITD